MRSTPTALLTIVTFAATTLWPAASVWAQQPQPSEQPQSDQSEESAEQDAPSFKELTQRGARAFQRKDYESASEAFKQAYEIRQIPNLLYNIGRSLEKQGDFEGALTYYERFVGEPDIEHKARRDALERLKTLREVIALREEGEKDKAERVQSEGEGSGEAELAETDVAEEPDAPGQTTTGPTEPAEQPAEESYALAYTFTGLGVASLAAGGVFAALAAGSSSDADDATSLAARRDAADEGTTHAALADGFVAGGALLSAVGLYFFLSPPTQEVAGADADADADSAASLRPSVAPDGASVTFTLEF